MMAAVTGRNLKEVHQEISSVSSASQLTETPGRMAENVAISSETTRCHDSDLRMAATDMFDLSKDAYRNSSGVEDRLFPSGKVGASIIPQCLLLKPKD